MGCGTLTKSFQTIQRLLAWDGEKSATGMAYQRNPEQCSKKEIMMEEVSRL